MPGRNRKMSRKRVNKSVRSKHRTRRTRRRMKGGAKGNEMSSKNIKASLNKLLVNDDSPSYKAWLAHKIMELNLLPRSLPEKTKKRFNCKSDLYEDEEEEECVNFLKGRVRRALEAKQQALNAKIKVSPSEAKPNNSQVVLFSANYEPTYIEERGVKPHEMRVSSKLIVPKSQYEIDINRVNERVQAAGVIPEDEKKYQQITKKNALEELQTYSNY